MDLTSFGMRLFIVDGVALKPLTKFRSMERQMHSNYCLMMVYINYTSLKPNVLRLVGDYMT